MSDFDFFDSFSIEETEPAEETKGLKKKCTTFENWHLLPNELKQIVISNLNFKCRLNLSLCSKSDYENVKNSKMKLKRIQIIEETSYIYGVYHDEVKFITVEVEFNSQLNERFELKFVNDEEEGCVLVSSYKYHYEKNKSFRTTNDYKTEATNFVIHCMKKCDFNLQSLTVEMDECSFQSDAIKSFDNLVSLRLNSKNEEWMLWWMNKAKKSNIKSLELLSRVDSSTNGTLSSQFIDKISSKLNVCESFYFWACPLFSDEQFLNLTAKKMTFDVGTNLSDKVINYFIRTWIDGKIRKDFKQFIGWMTRSYEKEALILKNLDGKMWDEEFIEEARGFTGDFERVVGRGECYQIKNKLWEGKSATLMLSSDRITFMVTGYIYNGWNMYSIPL